MEVQFWNTSFLGLRVDDGLHAVSDKASAAQGPRITYLHFLLGSSMSSKENTENTLTG
jgi:hypothetical protein